MGEALCAVFSWVYGWVLHLFDACLDEVGLVIFPELYGKASQWAVLVESRHIRPGDVCLLTLMHRGGHYCAFPRRNMKWSFCVNLYSTTATLHYPSGVAHPTSLIVAFVSKIR